jgi:hypothetical protein
MLDTEADLIRVSKPQSFLEVLQWEISMKRRGTKKERINEL